MPNGSVVETAIYSAFGPALVVVQHTNPAADLAAGRCTNHQEVVVRLAAVLEARMRQPVLAMVQRIAAAVVEEAAAKNNQEILQITMAACI